jgi:hypothetical protein
MMEWLEPKGEIIVIAKPQTNMDIEIITESETYSPGDQVNY